MGVLRMVFSMRRKLAIIGLTVVTAIWGGGFVASDIALGSFAPMQIMTIRFAIAALVMLVISAKQFTVINYKEILAGVGMGVALFAGFSLQTFGLQYTTPSKNAFITSLNVVIVPFLSMFLFKKRVGLKEIVGAVLSVLGVAILSLSNNFTISFGDLLTLLCALGFASQIVLTGIFVKVYRPNVLNCIQMCTAFLLSFIVMQFTGECHWIASPNGWISVIYLGFISTTVCYLLQTACQKYVNETQSAIVLSLEAVFGTLFSIILLNEIVTIRMIIGSAIILCAVLISSLPSSFIRRSTKE